MSFGRVENLEFEPAQIVVATTAGGLGGGHLGILFHSAKEGTRLLDLAWHLRLRNNSVPDQLDSCWIGHVVQLPELASKQVVSVVRSIAKRSPSINYGIDFIAARGSFAADGSYSPPKGSQGLTCATFVLEVFRAAAVRLVLEDSWPETEENRVWAERVCELLARGGASEDHVAAVRKSNVGLRIRPVEVAGAACSPMHSLPATFEVAIAAAARVEAALSEVCG